MLTRFETPLERCNLKFNGTASKGTFEGYAATFDNIDSFGDTIVKGAFSETIKNRDLPVLMLFGHSTQSIVGKFPNLKEDDIGLFVQGELTPGHTIASNVYASMKHGAVSGLSIGFRIPTGGAEDMEEGGGRRITKINLEEISIVAFPADSDARVSTVKAADIGQIESIRDAELFLREAGSLSRSMAKTLISQLRPLYQREVDQDLERKKVMARDLDWLRKLTNTE